MLFGSLVGVALLAMPVAVRGETTKELVARNLEELHAWLATSAYGEKWRRFLLTEQLEGELARQEAPDREVLASVLARFRDSNRGLSKPRFTAVRRVLERWTVELAAPQSTELATAARAAVDEFQPPEPAAIERQKQGLRSSVIALGRFLASGGSVKEQGWKKHLLWQPTLDQLESAEPDVRVLRAAELKYFGLFRGLELPVFNAVRQRLRDYTNALIVSDPRARAYYNDQVNKLAELLEDVELSASGDASLAIGRILGWLEMAGQAESLVVETRRVFLRPNLHVQVSENLLGASANTEIHTRQQIHENILGTDMYGYPETRAKVTVDFVPNDGRAAIDFRITGRAVSNNVGYNGPVTIYSSSNTSISGSKRIYLDSKGLHGEPAEASCWTSSTIHNIAARLWIIENIAWRRAGQQKPAAEQVGNRKSEDRVRRQVDAQADEVVAKMNRAFLDHFLLPLVRKDHLPRAMRFATSEDQLFVTMLQAGAFQLGATSSPPALESGLDMSVRVHESLVGNLSEGLVGGETLSDERLENLLSELTGEVPDELQRNSEKEPWSIKFAGSQPVYVRFDQHRIRIAVRGSEFTRGTQTTDEPIEISATYKIEKTPQGARLTREGEVEVEFLARQTLSVGQVAQKKFMQTKFGALFKSEIVGKGIEIKGRSKRATLLQLQQMSCDRGWAVFGWKASPAPLTAQLPAELER
jgi:hypothetical protein